MTLRRHRFAFTFLAALALTLFLAPLVKQEVFVMRDHFDYFQPLRWFTAQELRAGNLPLWNPWSASGEPWLANPQTGVFYPPAWLFLVLPFATAYMLYLAFHLVLLGWSAYLLFARNASQGAAILGAAALMFSGPVLSLLDVSNNLATLAWIPLALWCAAEGAWRRGGVVLALAFLAGEPFFAALAALLYVVVWSAAAKPPLSNSAAEPRRSFIQLLGTALIAIGLSAIQLLPFLEFVASSDRAGGMEDTLVLRHSMPLGDWMRLALPLERSSAQQFIPNVYVSIVVVALALIGVTTIRARRDVAAWLALLIAAMLIASGPRILAQLPLTLFRYPARLIPIAALALAALAVAGWQRVRVDRRWVDLLIVLIVVADLLPRARPLLATAPFRTDVVPYPAAIGREEKFLRFGEVNPARRTAWISGYLNLYDRRHDTFTAAPLATERYVRFYRDVLLAPTTQKLAHAGVGYILATPEAAPRYLRRVARAENVEVYRNRIVYPLTAHFAPGSKSLRRAQATLDTSSARIVIDAPADGVVVLRQQTANGWSVTVDGKPAPALTIDGMYRGVDVRKGAHVIVWKYRPISLFVGAAMTLLTLLALQISRFVKHPKSHIEAKNFSSCPSNLE
jgi:uncharacterized membrane protein YfhO